jgi:hypothetical protein
MKAPRNLIRLWSFVFLVSLFSAPEELYALTFTGPELLARSTDTSVTVHVVADTALQAYFEYGTTQGGPYTGQTEIITSTANEPIKAVIGGLTSNTRYFYRMVYSTNGGSNWTARAEHSFHTLRAQGSTFTFTMIADSHMNGGGGNVSLYQQTLTNANNDHPDFHFDLGDTFWMDGTNITSTIANQRYLAQRGWMGTVSHSAAIFLATGNHENEEGWNFDDTNSKALLSVNARKRYYPNPITDGFYSGNDDALAAIDGDHLREDYYAWQWGDALFVVIDPYHYTMVFPYDGGVGGEDNDETLHTHDRWDWTLGLQQFNWLKQTLQNSNAKYKIVFAHHMLGGAEDFVRGGAAYAHMFEWGGYDIDGTTWGFDRERPGWGGVPVHQLMVANGVNAFFYGHDHLYAYQKRDGVVYQEVPSAGLTGSGLQNYYNDSYTLKLLPSPGHIRVAVSPSQATVDFVQTSGGVVADSYTILPASYLYGDYAPTDCDVDGSDLAAWIANGAPAGRDIATLAGNFGRNACP